VGPPRGAKRRIKLEKQRFAPLSGRRRGVRRQATFVCERPAAPSNLSDCLFELDFRPQVFAVAPKRRHR
jgi:hypothetical protein